MKIFLDTAELSEIEKAASTGLLDGVTTNPSLVAKTGKKFEDLLAKICQLVNGPVSAEVTAEDSSEMLSQGKALSQIHPNIYVKVPLTFDGLKAARKFSEMGIRTNVTLCFSPVQAMMAAKAGASFVSPFVGRLDDIGENGMDLIRQIMLVYRNYNVKTQVLVASVRHIGHVIESLQIGADIATIPYKVFEQLTKHPLTDLGIERFLKDWKAAQK